MVLATRAAPAGNFVSQPDGETHEQGEKIIDRAEQEKAGDHAGAVEAAGEHVFDHAPAAGNMRDQGGGLGPNEERGGLGIGRRCSAPPS